MLLNEYVSVASAIISTIAAFIAVRNTNINLRMARLKEIIDSTALFIAEVNPHKYHWENFKKKNYVSDQHMILESKIILLLHENIKKEKEMIDIVLKFRNDCSTEDQYINLRSKLIAQAREITKMERRKMQIIRNPFK